MNATLVVLCFLGFVVHFCMRWGEYWRTKERIWPGSYILHDLPGWVSSIAATIALMLLLQSLPAILGLPPQVAASNLMDALAFVVGYSGSSIAAKVPAMFTGKGER